MEITQRHYAIEKADYAVFSSKKTDYALFSRHSAIPQIRESAFFHKKVGGFRDFMLKRAQFRPLLGKSQLRALFQKKGQLRVTRRDYA